MIKRLATHSPLLVCALLAVAGGLILDDYGLGTDESEQRSLAVHIVNYILQDNDEPLNVRPYGPVFEMALLAGERLLGLQSYRSLDLLDFQTRRIYLMRHFLTHLLFLGGGWCCAWLTFRRYGSRGLALCALGLFLLHPRLYAHSFFNSKDLPFLSLFMMALCLMHRAFRKDTLAAFALCGAGIGLLINLRFMGAMLFVAVLVLRACDAYLAADQIARRHILRTCGLFAAASALTLYATWPYLWDDPVGRLAMAFRYMSYHETEAFDLFRGAVLPNEERPPDYIPTWLAITTPPFTLLLGAFGGLAVWRGAARRRGAALRNTSTRFDLLLLACFLLPLLLVILLEADLYDGWRHMYFLYAPLCLLAVAGLQAALAAWPQGKKWAYGLTGSGLGATLAAMAWLHPHQYDYFNFLVDRATPERLGAQYELDYWGIASWEALDYLRARYPGSFYVNDSPYGEIGKNRQLLPAADQPRIALDNLRADFYIHYDWPRANAHAVYAPSFTRRVYGNALFDVAALNLSLVDEATAAPYRAHYRAATARPAVAQSRFDVYLDEQAVTYVQEPCRLEDTQPRFFLHVTPVDPRRLPAAERESGFANLDFAFYRRGVRLENACLATVPLPAYALKRIRTGQWLRGQNRALWQADIPLALSPDTRQQYRTAYEALAADALAVRSVFDVYVTAEAATYVKTPCQAADAEPKFILHVIPVRIENLPAGRHAHGFDNLDFQFDWQGAHFDGTCLAQAALPSYAIKSLRVGQFHAGESLWQEEIRVAR